MSKPTTGLVLGKFMPPHLGHAHLLGFAARCVERLTVLVCSLEREPIAGALRHGWVRELCAGHAADVVHVTDDLPQAPEETADPDRDFWPVWRAVCARHAGRVDVVFASEAYGERLASELGARFVPVDVGRRMVPVSGSAIRADPMRHWRYLPACVRPHFVKRVCVFGPESTGKSTLAADLAAHFGTVHVAEFARELLDAQGGRCEAGDLDWIVRGQLASEDALARQAERVLVCDTDALTTRVWAETLFGACPPAVAEAARARSYDLTLLCDVDVPWVDDAQRFLPHAREAFRDRCVEALEAHGRAYVWVRGDWAQRRRTAIDAVQRLIDG